MSSSARTGRTARPARWTLLVLAVLTGVLAMHVLTPAGMPSSGQHSAMATVETAGHHAMSRHAPVHLHGDPCAHLTGVDQDGMAMQHAGGTCAAAGTSTAYVPPALPEALLVPGGPAAPASAGAAVRAAEGRAPPELAELQLLRI